MDELKDMIQKELQSEYELTDNAKCRHNNRDKTLHQGMIVAYETVMEMIEELEGDTND